MPVGKGIAAQAVVLAVVLAVMLAAGRIAAVLLSAASEELPEAELLGPDPVAEGFLAEACSEAGCSEGFDPPYSITNDKNHRDHQFSTVNLWFLDVCMKPFA